MLTRKEKEQAINHALRIFADQVTGRCDEYGLGNTDQGAVVQQHVVDTLIDFGTIMKPIGPPLTTNVDGKRKDHATVRMLVSVSVEFTNQ